MKRNASVNTATSLPDQDLVRQIVFHEAGHAAAIHLNNKQKQLPAVAFEITMSNPMQALVPIGQSAPDHWVAMVEGGCLINSLPIAVIESAHYYADEGPDAYRTAFEADIVNLLVGPLAEAKHIALRDNAAFGDAMLEVGSLSQYGGNSDIERVYRYLGDFIAEPGLHEAKLAELFKRALEFVNTPVHWLATEHLAAYILNSTKSTITCEEAISVLDAGVLLFGA
ncbi:MAG: hypothetical protein HOP34_05145 [Methylococcaceae bacterium]|nr:hypothetical protein [Methylococcaceae bacterium]